MHPLIEKLFKKRGIKDINNLDEDEKETFDKYNGVLSKKDLTVGDIKEFCQKQIREIEHQCGNPDNSPQKKDNFFACLAVYTAILGAIEGPQAEREATERELEDLINK